MEYTFEYTANANSVSVALSCFDWKPNVHFLEKHNNTFTLKIRLPKTKIYYKYVLDNSNWQCDHNKQTEKDRDGNFNNIIDLNETESQVVSNHIDFGDNFADLKIIRREINLIRNLARDFEYFLHQENDCIAIFRIYKEIHPTDHFHGICLIARCSYDGSRANCSFKVELPGLLSEVMFLARVNVEKYDLNKVKKDEYIHGVNGNLNFTNSLNDLRKICNIYSK